MPAISPTIFTGPYTANGTQTAFSFDFSIVGAADILVEVDGTAVPAPSYTVEFITTGGTVTFTAPPAPGAQVLLLSAPDYLQTSEFENEGAYNLATINTINRRAAVKALVTEDKASRALKVPRGEEGLEIPLSDVASIVAVGENLLAGSDIPTVAGAIGDVATVAAGIADVGTVAGVAAQVADVAAISGAVTTVAAIDDEVVTVAGISAAVTQVAGNGTNINAVAAISTEVGAVAAIAVDVSDVADIAADVTTAATNITDINSVVTNMAAIIDAPNQAAIATAAAAAVAAGNIVFYGRGAPDAMTGGPNGATYIDVTSGRQYGPKTGGVWPSRFILLGMPGAGYEPVTVVFMMGQSNADGWSTNYSTTTALANGYGYEYYYNNGGFGAVLPLGLCRLGRTQGGPQSAFAQTWAAGGGGACVFVDCAAGGSTLYKANKGALTGTNDLTALSGGTWDQSDPDNLYTNYYRAHMFRALTELQRLGFAVVRKVVYFSLGETEASTTTQAQYDAALRVLATKVKTDFPDIYWLTEGLGTNSTASNAAGSANIRAAQVAVAADAAYSPWMAIGSNAAQGFSALGYFSDTLHYNQTGYDIEGTNMATVGLPFAKANSILPVPDGLKYTDLLTHMPPVNGWYRMGVTTTANGTFQINVQNDPTTPYAATWYDTSGVNRADATQALNWTFPNANAKEIILYAHVSTGTTLTVTAFNGNAKLSAFATIDEGFPLFSLVATGTEQINGMPLTDASIYRLSSTKFKTLNASASTPNLSGAAITNVALAKLSALTSIDLARTPGVGTIDLTLTPNVTRLVQPASGLSVAQVNARLVALDANGKTNGTISLSQFLSGVYPVAIPTGAGATAKTSLQSKGWTVTTD